jgi:hypothetical protein
VRFRQAITFVISMVIAFVFFYAVLVALGLAPPGDR